MKKGYDLIIIDDFNNDLTSEKIMYIISKQFRFFKDGKFYKDFIELATELNIPGYDTVQKYTKFKTSYGL